MSVTPVQFQSLRGESLAAAGEQPAAPAVPRFSVIVSNYNYAAFVAAAIDSALAQTHLPLQILVVDDGSTDGSPALLRARYGGHPLVQLIEKPNGGQLSAFQAGMAQVRGEVTCFLDADDLWRPDYLQALSTLYAERQDVDFVYGNLSFFGALEGTWFAPELASRDEGLTVIEATFGRHWRGAPTSAISLRSRLARRLLSLPEHFLPDWRSRADDVLVYGAGVAAARKYYLGQVVADYRVHGQNAWIRRDESRLDALRYHYQVHRLIEHFREQMGLGERVLALLPLELRTRRGLCWEEVQTYIGIIRSERRHFGFLGTLAALRSVLSYYLQERQADRQR